MDYKKIAKKVGEGKYDHYGHPTAIVGGKKVLRGLKKVGVMGLVLVNVLSLALAPVGLFGPVKVAEAATYTFTQTDWSGGATSTTAVHPTNQSGWTYASTTDNQIATSTAGQLTLKTTASSTTQTTQAEFNGTNATTTVISNSVRLATSSPSVYYTSGIYTSGVLNTGQKSDFTTASWTATTTGADTFTHTSDGDFSGTSASTTVSGGSVKLTSSLEGQIGDGSLGAYSCATGTCNLAGGTYNYTTFNISSGATVNVSATGSQLIIKATGDVTIAGTLNANGTAGSGANGGAAGAGGANGGTSSGYGGSGGGGIYIGGNGGANTYSGGGGGGGSTGAGGNGANGSPYTGGAGGANGGGGGGNGNNRTAGGGGGNGGAGGASAGTNGGAGGGTYTTELGGSGGGGGGYRGSTNGGGGGGGGGGYLKIVSGGSITNSGTINVNGNVGGVITNGNGGGGGSGGTIRLSSFFLTNSGTINAKGGAGGSGYTSGGYGGGGGGGGRVYLTAPSITSGNISVNGGTGGNASYLGANGSAGTTTISQSGGYLSPGAYTSPIREIGTGAKFKSIAWAETLNGQTISMKVRTCNDAACSGEPAFSTLSNIVNGQDYSSSLPTGVNNGDGWIQYEATLSTTNGTITPTLDSVTINTVPLVLEARAGNTAAPDGAWTAWTEIGSGGTSSVNLGTTFDGKQYIQYRAKFSTVNTTYTPSLDDITFNYQYYPTASSYNLISSAFDSTSPANAMGSLSWDQTLPSASTTATVSLRTASTTDLLASATWYDFATSTSGCTHNASTITCDSSVLNTVSSGNLTNGVNDQWWEYKTTLSTTNSAQTPTVTEVRAQYVVNAPPEFDTAYGGGNGLQVYQTATSSDSNWGKVVVNYWAKDTDTDGGVTPFSASSTIEYSTSTPAVWNLISTASTTIATTTSAYLNNLWSATSSLPNFYSTTTQIRVTLNDREAANNTASVTDTFTLDTERPSFSAFTAGSASTNNVQFTDADADGVADNRNVTLRLVNLVESSSSTQGVYVLFSNDGTNYGTSTNSVTGALTATSTQSDISQWLYVSGANVATATSSWTLLQSGNRSKTVYMKIKDGFNNEIATPASTTVTWNKRPQFSVGTISDSDNSSILTASSTSGAMIRQCDVYDTDANCSAGKVKLIYAPRDPDANESGLATKGQLSTTFAYSTSSGATWNTFTISGAATTTVATSSADIAGGYNPVYSTTTTYWDASALGSQNDLRVRVTVDDNEAGANTASSTSNTIAYDKTNPSGNNITFDAGVAGATGSASITIPWWNDTNTATNTIQYVIADTSTNSSPANTGWTTVAKNATTTKTWTFDSGIETKSLDFRYRDIYGNTIATTTISTVAPADPDAFLVQDVSKRERSDWKIYVGWGISTSTSFSSYQLEYATSSDSASYGNYAIVANVSPSSTNYYVHDNLTGGDSGGLYYRYRLGVKDTNGNISVRSSAYKTTKPNGVQDQDEGGGGTASNAAVVENVVPTQAADKTISVAYRMTDNSSSTKGSVSYEAYLFYNTGITLTSSTASTITVSNSSKMPSSGFIQINNEIIRYGSNATSTGILSSLTRGTWPTASTTRATRQNTIFFEGTPVWIKATSTTPVSISLGDGNTISWNTYYESTLAGSSYSSVGIRVLSHDNQTAAVGPLSSQNDYSEDGILGTLDLSAPTIQFSATSASSTEGNISATSTIILSRAYPYDAIVNYSFSGTAIGGGTDYSTSSAQTATISAGATSTVINFSINSDAINETNETIIITLSSPTSASVGASSTYTYTINDNDNATVSFANATSSGAESVATATISIVLPSASGQDVSVNYSFSGMASSTTDYSTTTAQTATISSGNTSTTISIAIIDDASNEEDETIIISLSSPINATLGATTTYTYTIIDNDNSAPQFSTTTLVSVDRVATSSDSNFGKAIITYLVRDADTNVALNSANRYKITPSFEFSTGGSWQSISSSSIALASSTDNIKQDFNQSVALTDYQAFTATWTPTSTSAAIGVYSSTTQIRITLSDGETKNSTSTATSTLFALDTKAPTATFTINSSNDNINLTVVEDSAFQYRVSNNSDLSSDGVNTSSTIVSGTWYPISATSTYTATSSWIFATSTYEIIYTEAKDAFNNISTSTIVAPYIPSNFIIKDITNLSLSKYQEFLSWDAYTATTSAAFSSYQIYRATSTDGVYALLTSITNANTVNYSDLNLSSSTTYYYKMRIVDSDNDISGYSLIVSDQPDAADDTIAPTFSNITATPDTNWAKISWNTNELSDSAVDYGLTSSSYTASSTSATLIASSTAHEITLSSLSTSTTYYYRIRSTDVAGNQGASAESSFTTLNGPVITNVACIDATDNSIKIIWNTDINSDSIVNYATSAAAVSLASDVGSGNVGESASSSVSGTTRYQHTVTLSGLAQGTNYYFRVKSTANSIASILNNNNNYYQCKTSYDTKPPVISDIATPLITDTSAVITWTTDEPSTSKVEYGTASAATNNYTSSTSRDNALTISHVVTITGLARETKYYYRVQSYDMNPDSATAVSEEQNLTTASEKQTIIVYISSGGGGGGIVEKDTTAPVISNIQISDITSFEATVSFDTNEDAIGIIEYGSTADYGLSTAASNYTKSQTIKLSGLRMGIDYHFRIKAIDKSGNYAYSGDQAFKTKYFAESIKELITLDRAYQFQEELEKSIESVLPSLLPPFIEEPRVLDITENSAVIKWKTNVAAYSVVSYASENDYELNKAKDNPYTAEISNTDVKTTDHELKIIGLASNTKYHFIVKSFSFPKAVGVSHDMVFVTKAAKVKPRIADIDKDAIRIVWTTDEKASSIVEYRNTRTGDSNRLIKEEKVIDHDVRLENLSPDTVYEIKIMGYSEKNNLIEGGGLITVKTSKDIIAPTISNLKIDSALVPGRTDRIQTIVSWKTNEPANSVVEYEEGSGKSSDALANSDGDKQFYSDNHDVIITKLKPGALYRIRVISVDEAGNKTASPIRTIITPRQSESIVDVIVKNFEDTFQFLKKIR